MSFPCLPYDQVISVLRRSGWAIVRHKGCHIRLQKQATSKTLKLIVPALRPVLGSTLAHILKQAQLSVDEFNERL